MAFAQVNGVNIYYEINGEGPPSSRSAGRSMGMKGMRWSRRT